MLRERLVPALMWLAAGAIMPVAALHFFGREEAHVPNTIHFAAVGAGAFVSTVAALALTWAGARRRDGRVVLVGSAFSVMAVLLLIHGLSTPGLLLPYNEIIAFTGAATLPVGGAILALSALPALRRPEGVGVRILLVLLAAVLGTIVVLAVVGALFPSLVPEAPEAGGPAALTLLAGGTLFYGVLGLRAFRTFLLTRRRADLAVVCGLALLSAALAAALTVDAWSIGWWLGHGLEVAGIALVGGVVAFDLHRTAQSRSLIGDLKAAELVASEEAFLGSHVRALMIRLAEKDEYTEGHTRRVALLAVEVGEELGLAPGRLRALATGGLLHDIGKLSVPDAILKKPGPLTEAEFAVIRRHPERGYRLLAELGGFSEAARRLVRSHHERMDGSGYPEQLRGDDVDLEMRILGACDVYDALVSTRVYRDAWTHSQAMTLLRVESEGFDQSCVAALERVLGRETQAVADGRWKQAPAPLLPGVATVFASVPGRIDRRP